MAGRPPLPVGTWGAITVTATPGGYRARTRFRDFDGVTRVVERVGRTKGGARSALTSSLADRSAPAGEDITASTRLSVVAPIYLAEGEGRWAMNTARRYREVIDDHVLPGVGGLRVCEATVPALDRFLKTITRETGAPTAKLCRTVLSGMLGLAVRHGAAATNPLRDVAGITVTRRPPRALTLDEVQVLRAAVQRWERRAPAAADGERPSPRRGRPPVGGLADVLDVLLGTGARIGEVLALRWCDVALDEPALTITGTVVRDDDGRIIRQDHPKTGGARRRLHLPAFAAATLLRRRVTGPTSDGDLVFPSAAGTVRDPGNVRKPLRAIRADIGLGWVTPHTMRRTVATLVEADADLRAAADQLGHQGTDVTERHYVARTHQGPDVRSVLDALGPLRISGE